MLVGQLAPYHETADNVRNLLVLAAATLAALATIITILLAFRRWVRATRGWKLVARKASWVWLKLWTEPRQESRAAERAAANARILVVVKQAISPLEAKIDEIAHSTNGKKPGDPTMSAEITALTGTVDQIASGLAEHRTRFEEIIGEQLTPRLAALETAQRAVTDSVSLLAERVAALEGKQHDPHPQPPAANPLPHRRHTDA